MLKFRSFFLYALAFLSGAILPLGLAPFRWWPCGLLSPAFLLGLNLYRPISPLKGALLGLWYGLGLFGIGVSWVFVSIHEFGMTPVPLALLITVGFVLVLSLFTSFQNYCFIRWNSTLPSHSALLLFPAWWVIFEWLRSWVFSGFPWAFLGVTQLSSSLKYYAPLGSVYLVSWLVALCAGALYLLWIGNNKTRLWSVSLVTLIWGGSAVLPSIHWTTPCGPNHTVTFIQSNITPFDKFTSAEPLKSTWQHYIEPTLQHWADLVLWPEGAIPIPLPESKALLEDLDSIAKNKKSTLITGIAIIEQEKIYNSLIAVGAGQGFYHKHHLVPFGDYLPFENHLRGLINFCNLPMSSFNSGSLMQAPLRSNRFTLAGYICYEIAFPDLIRATLHDAKVIINLSEDGWFGRSFGPPQHLDLARMRALETGRYVLRATTSGITAVINEQGDIMAQAPPFQAAILKSHFREMQGTTPWVRMGSTPFIILLFLFIFISVIYNRIKKGI